MLPNLKNQVSLYLKEYSNTLVNWFPWEEESFKKARDEKKPIFLSIGYSGSALCKKMKEESFNNKIIADLLNKNFISIKVDRDERVDIDKFYKKVYRLMNGQNCSSPISIFMSEDLEPFYTVSYIPIYPRGNILGFQELLEVITDKYNIDRDTLKEKAKEVLSYIEPKDKKIEATRLNSSILKTISLHLDELFDKENGGFGDAPKFLQTSIFDLILEYYKITNQNNILNKLTFTLNSMANREIFDKKKGGFYRYANEKDWSNPRLEKMSYENANITSIYIETYKITNNILYRDIAIKNIDFILKYFYKESIFGSNLVENRDGSIFIDSKVVTSFNAMVIDMLFLASTIDKKYLDIAVDSLDTLIEKYYINGELYHTYNIEGFLEDYAYLGLALLRGYEMTSNQEYLILSQSILNSAIDKFYNYGRWKFSNSDIDVYDDIYDIDYPSATSKILYLIEKISPLVEGDYSHILFKTLEFNSYNLMRQPLSYPEMSRVLLLYLKDDIIAKK